MQRADSRDAADLALRARCAAARAGYFTQPIESPTVSGWLPPEERKQRHGGAFGLMPVGRREERVEVPTREVVCYECGKSSRIPVAALSAHCVHCRCHLNTADIVLKPGSRRLTLRTLGDVSIPAHVELSQLRITCRNLTVSGKGEGHMQCSGTLTLRGSAKLAGQVQADELRVSSGAQATAEQSITVEEAVLEGVLRGSLTVNGLLRIARGGRLVGDCRAERLCIEPGGAHEGHWLRI